MRSKKYLSIKNTSLKICQFIYLDITKQFMYVSDNLYYFNAEPVEGFHCFPVLLKLL